MSTQLPKALSEEIVDTVRHDGIWISPQPFMRLYLGDVHKIEPIHVFVEHLKRCILYNSHVAAKATLSPEPYHNALSWPIFAPHMHDVIRAPFFFEVALSFAKVAWNYYHHRQPYLYSINAFWSNALGGEVYTDTQAWHRDGDAPDQFTIFMLGSDVLKPEDGAHLFQKGTHKIPDDQLGWNFRDDPPNSDTIATVMGKAGTLLVANTQGLHKAIQPSTRPRLLVWARYSTLCPPQSYYWDGLSPISRHVLGDRYPSDPWLQEVIKLVAA